MWRTERGGEISNFSIIYERKIEFKDVIIFSNKFCPILSKHLYRHGRCRRDWIRTDNAIPRARAKPYSPVPHWKPRSERKLLLKLIRLRCHLMHSKGVSSDIKTLVSWSKKNLGDRLVFELPSQGLEVLTAREKKIWCCRDLITRKICSCRVIPVIQNLILCRI